MLATKKQVNFIQILANDLEMDRHRRNVYISEILERDFNGDLDSLFTQEASIVIDKLLQLQREKS